MYIWKHFLNANSKTDLEEELPKNKKYIACKIILDANANDFRKLEKIVFKFQNGKINQMTGK